MRLAIARTRAAVAEQAGLALRHDDNVVERIANGAGQVCRRVVPAGDID